MRLLLFASVDATDWTGRPVRRLVDTLRDRGHTVDIVGCDHDNLPLATETETAIISWQDEDAVRASARRADECIFIIGNSYAHSAGCADWLSELSGIAYFQDVVLDRLFLGWWRADHDTAHRVLEALHGALTARRFEQVMATDPSRGLRFLAATAPMGAWLAGKTRGAICASHGAAAAIAASCPGPVIVSEAILAAVDPRQHVAPGTRPSEVLCVLAVLASGSVWRVETLVTAVSLSAALRSAVDISYLTLDEHDTESDALTRRATELGVRLTPAGSNALDQANVVANLCDPRIDAPSPIVLEAIARGIPVIVSGNGFSTRIPVGIAMRVEPGNEYTSLAAHLTSVCARREPSADQDRSNTRSWLRQITNPEPLADAVLALVAAASTVRPATRAIDRIGRILTGWEATASTVEAIGAFDALDLFDAVLAPPMTHPRSADRPPVA